MDRINIIIGTLFIVIGVWFFISLSALKIEEGSDPERVIIKEGIIREDDELAYALAEDIGFDIKGAFREGYTPRDVVDYLIREPHKYSIALYDNRFYEGRITVLYVIPFSVCIFFIVTGTVIIFIKVRKRGSSKVRK